MSVYVESPAMAFVLEVLGTDSVEAAGTAVKSRVETQQPLLIFNRNEKHAVILNFGVLPSLRFTVEEPNRDLPKHAINLANLSAAKQ